MVLSAYRLTQMLEGAPGIWKPCMSGEFRMEAASGSMARLNSRQERGSPWQTPLVMV